MSLESVTSFLEALEERPVLADLVEDQLEGKPSLLVDITSANYNAFLESVVEDLRRSGLALKIGMKTQKLSVDSSSGEDKALLVRALQALTLENKRLASELAESQQISNKNQINLRECQLNLESAEKHVENLKDELEDVRRKCKGWAFLSDKIVRAEEKSFNQKEKQLRFQVKELEKNCKVLKNRDGHYKSSIRKLEDQVALLQKQLLKSHGITIVKSKPVVPLSSLPATADEEIFLLRDSLEDQKKELDANHTENLALRDLSRSVYEGFLV
jgi:chromosome segregation ATPase